MVTRRVLGTNMGDTYPKRGPTIETLYFLHVGTYPQPKIPNPKPKIPNPKPKQRPEGFLVIFTTIGLDHRVVVSAVKYNPQTYFDPFGEASRSARRL